MSRVTPISGFPEWLPADRIVEQHFLDVIRDTFELHGFASIETRAVEPVDRLSNQGEDADKEIYGVRRLGAGPDEDGPGLGLHFDLTAGSASSPRPTSTSWTPARCRSTTRSSCRW